MEAKRSAAPCREPRPVSICGLLCKPRLPKTGSLCKLLALMVGLLVVFHAASCGYFFCVRFPGVLDFPRDIYDDIRDIYILAGGPRSTSRAQIDVDASPKLIPKLIHQTFKSGSVPASVRPFMQSWRRYNEDWEIRFYDDEACLQFVQREFPEYLDAYRSLPKDVERSDFFRYMVVLRLGGVYADMDTECRKPLNNLIAPRDTMVVGWENEFSSDEEAAHRHYARTRQVLQWVFAAAPGHPVLREICDHIARNADMQFSENTNRDTLERTGPGVWTDIILKHAHLHPPSKRDDPWNVRILPTVQFGVHPMGLDHMSPDDPDIIVLHHFLGSWKVRGGWTKPSKQLAKLLRWAFPFWFRPKQVAIPAEQSPEQEAAPPALDVFPVSIVWEPPYTMLVNLRGHGDPQAGVDVSATLTSFGTWQPALAPARGPTYAEALVGSLGSSASRQRVLLDIGAGIGFFSLAAAARGHRAIAFELSPNSADTFERSIEYNGFQHLVALHKVALGAVEEDICTHWGQEAEVELYRGYSTAAAHNISAGAPGSNCTRTERRHVAADMVPNDTEIGAVRVSVTGWEGWVVEGLKGVIEHSPPSVVMVELHPQAMEATGHEGALKLLRQLYSWGYTDVSHSGYVCDERWHNITRGIRLRGAMGVAAQEALKQPTWCTLQPDKFESLVARTNPKYPENILFTYKSGPAGSAAAASAPQDSQTASAAISSTSVAASNRAVLVDDDTGLDADSGAEITAASAAGAAGPTAAAAQARRELRGGDSTASWSVQRALRKSRVGWGL
ncbi:hypothetical protein WJX72_000034 [[Myrmecia] bisecta]|uniref:tRNA(Phe) (4-demethylwyosine(37)-C(7)) aminocarboxypropyltransferase n=1 Tax=[Myrmecia] bisecta TaxID=41462 RepID=A0AAW1PCC2_9CHLO